MKNKVVFFIALFCFLFAEGNAQDNLKKKIVGKWCNPYTYQSSGELKGFHFKKDGTCQSVNIPSLELKTWEIQGDRLIIKGYSIEENGKKVPYETDERISRLNRDSLSLVTQEANPHLEFLYLNTKVIKKKVEKK